MMYLSANTSFSWCLIDMNLEDFLWGFDMVLAIAVSWATLIADYARYSYTSNPALTGTWTGYTITSIILYGLGALAALVAKAYLGDPTQVVINLGLNTLFLYFIALKCDNNKFNKHIFSCSLYTEYFTTDKV